MARSTSEALTDREAEVMDVVWRLGEATAEQVRESLAGSPHDSTVRTLLRILEAKGYVTHDARGKVYVYRAAVERQKAQNLAIQGMLKRFFAGSAENLVLRLIEDEQLSPDQLDSLRKSSPPVSKKRRRNQGDAS